MRDPATIADDLTALHQTAALAFVPINVKQALTLSVEFAQSVAQTLRDAGLIEQPADAAPDSTEPGAAA